MLVKEMSPQVTSLQLTALTRLRVKFMFISIALLGFGNVAKEVYKRLQTIPGFMEDFRIHIVQVPDMSNHKIARDENGYNYIDDFSFGTTKQITIGDDLDWFLQSDGHDTIIDCTSYNESSKELIFELAKRKYWILTCSKELVNKHGRELVDIAKSSDARLSFNAIPASATPCEYDKIDLNQETFLQYSDDSLYIFRDADAGITADYIVKEIIIELKKRRDQKKLWESMSTKDQQSIIDRDSF